MRLRQSFRHPPKGLVEISVDLGSDMNTPAKIKRHQLPRSFGNAPDGHYAAGIVQKDIGAAFAKFVTSFEELDAQMSAVLAILLGGHDKTTAGYVLRSIRNPSTKRDLMSDLLRQAKVNEDLPEQYDKILREYDKISIERNQLVHGRWFTLIPEDDVIGERRVFLSRSNEHDLAFFLAEEFKNEDLEPWFERLTTLTRDIIQLVGAEIGQRAHRAKELQQFHDDAQDPRNHRRMLRGTRNRPPESFPE